LDGELNRESAAPTYKVVIAGERYVGKTALIHRFLTGAFLDQSADVSTVHQTSVTVDPNDQRIVNLTVWDAAEQFRHPREDIYRGAFAVALVYDMTSPSTFFDVMRRRDEVQVLVPLVPILVVGNKSDLFAVIPAEEARGWAESMHMPFLMTSARTGENVIELFALLAELAIQENQRREERTRLLRR
jgi:small GTP-binding protein